MRYFNIIMWVMRGLAGLIIIFCVYVVATEKFDLRQLIPILIPFIIIYFLASFLQIFIRFRRTGRYPKESKLDKEKKND